MPKAVQSLVSPSYRTSEGQQRFVKLADLQVGDDGTLTIPAAYSEGAAWLTHLYETGVITAVEGESGTPAMVLRAADWGSLGNNVTVQVTPNATDTTAVDVTVSFADVRSGLTETSIVSELGDDSGKLGTKPSLVRVKGTVAGVPADQDVTLASGGASARSFADLTTSSAGAALTLEAKGNGSDGDATKVSITGSSDTAGTFTMTVTWEMTLTGVTTATAATEMAKLAYLVTTEVPAGATALALPRAGGVRLSGGADASQAVATPLSASS